MKRIISKKKWVAANEKANDKRMKQRNEEKKKYTHAHTHPQIYKYKYKQFESIKIRADVEKKGISACMAQTRKFIKEVDVNMFAFLNKNNERSGKKCSRTQIHFLSNSCSF